MIGQDELQQIYWFKGKFIRQVKDIPQLTDIAVGCQ